MNAAATEQATALGPMRPCDRCGKDTPAVALMGRVIAVTCDECCAEIDKQRTVAGFRSHLAKSGIPEPLWSYDAALAPNPGLLTWCVDHSSGWMWLGGPTGSGKTRALARAAVVYCWRNRSRTPSVHWAEAALWCEAMRGRDADAKREQARLIEAAQKSDILVMDDFGQEALDERSRSLLWGLIDHRYTRRLQTWFTTNASGADLEERIGPHRWPAMKRRIHERGWFYSWRVDHWEESGAFGNDATETHWWNDL